MTAMNIGMQCMKPEKQDSLNTSSSDILGADSQLASVIKYSAVCGM